MVNPNKQERYPAHKRGECRTYFVYILECSDGSLYIGSTRNVENRIKAHNSGKGAVFTSQRRPVRLVYKEPFPCLEFAVKRERQIKKWSRGKKEALIRGDLKALKNLSKHRNR
jgi:putative endonuclease